MSLIRSIDHGIRRSVFSVVWWFLDPLEPERLYSQLTDVMDRNLDVNQPGKLLAPENYDISVNNKVFIKHAHSVKKLEAALQDRLRKYAAERDYELAQAMIRLQIISSATISRRKTDIRCWYSTEAPDAQKPIDEKKYQLKIVDGDGKGTQWQVQPGNVYSIGRLSTANICLPYDKISKTQATLYFMSEGKITLVDEGSANGTFIAEESEPIAGSRQLKLGEKIRFCKVNPTVLILSTE
jgi:hypothetical protein